MNPADYQAFAMVDKPEIRNQQLFALNTLIGKSPSEQLKGLNTLLTKPLENDHHISNLAVNVKDSAIEVPALQHKVLPEAQHVVYQHAPAPAPTVEYHHEEPQHVVAVAHPTHQEVHGHHEVHSHPVHQEVHAHPVHHEVHAPVHTLYGEGLEKHHDNVSKKEYNTILNSRLLGYI